jgi:hypothetical protein
MTSYTVPKISRSNSFCAILDLDPFFERAES